MRTEVTGGVPGSWLFLGVEPNFLMDQMWAVKGSGESKATLDFWLHVTDVECPLSGVSLPGGQGLGCVPNDLQFCAKLSEASTEQENSRYPQGPSGD